MPILDGSAVARQVREELKGRAQALAELGRPAKLAAVLVGDDPASHTYVRMKSRQSEQVGIESETYFLSADASQAELIDQIDRLNSDPRVSGILLQHPVPNHLDEHAALSRILPAKDVDGISPYSLGALVAGIPGFGAATPLGIVRLLDHYQLPIEGQRAVVLGRSVILGKPVAFMLLNRHATVTICHSRTRDLPSITRQADILVAAVGKPALVKGDWVKPGSVVIDAGYNRVSGQKGDVGDVEFESAACVAKWITPVPGGVGPMTIAMLLSNTILAAEASQ